MQWRRWWPAWVLGAVALVVAVLPGVWVAGEVVAGLSREGWPSGGRLGPGLFVRTAGVALGIGALATLLALPAAWAGRRVPGRVFLLYVTPMLMPSYLAYVGWGLLRAPGTALGDFLLRGPPGARPGENWYPVVAAKVFAVGGLVLWAWPLAALVVGAAVRRIDEGVLDSLRMEAGWWRRGWAVIGMVRWAVAAAVGGVALLMFGSSVPLHVSQIETYAVEVWRGLDEVGPGERWRVWAASWPLVVVALAAGWAVARMGAGAAGQEGSGARWRWGWGAGLACGVWGLSVLVPIGLLVANLSGWGAMERFWLFAARPFWWSAGIAAGVGVSTVVVAAAAWAGLNGRGRRLVVGSGGVLAVAGLVPGVLVGMAVARVWGGGWVGDSAGIVVLAHLARFAFLGVLGGWLLSRMEGREARDLRMLEAGESVQGWVEAAVWPRLGLVAAMGVGVGLLSFHEIEATVMVQPPTGMGGGFAWKVLQALHFNREDDLVPAMLLVMGVGLGLSLAVVGLIGGVGRKREGERTN